MILPTPCDLMQAMVMSTPCAHTKYEMSQKQLAAAVEVPMLSGICDLHLAQSLEAVPLLGVVPFQGSLLCCPLAPLLVDNARHAVSSSVVHLV